MPPPRTRKRTLNNITNISGAALQALTESVTNEIRSLGNKELTEETARQLAQNLIAKNRSDEATGEDNGDDEGPQPKKKKKGRKPMPKGTGMVQVSERMCRIVGC